MTKLVLPDPLDSVEARLRAALVLEHDPVASDDGIDMSPEAVTRRILDCAEMSSLCLELGRGGSHAADDP